METRTTNTPRPCTAVPQPTPPSGAHHPSSSSTSYEPTYPSTTNEYEQVLNKESSSRNPGARPSTRCVALPLVPPNITYNVHINVVATDPRPETVSGILKAFRPDSGQRDSRPDSRLRRPALPAPDAPGMIMLGSSHGKRTIEALEGQQESTAFKRRKPDGVAITQADQAGAQEGLPVSWDEIPVAKNQMPTTIVNGYPSISVKRSESESSRLNSPAVAHYEPVVPASSASVAPPPGTPVHHGLRHNPFPDERQHRATSRPTPRPPSSAGFSTPRMSHRSESRASSRAQVDRLLREEYEFPDVPCQSGLRTPRIPTLDLRDAARSGQSGYRRHSGKSRPMGPPPPIPGPSAPTRAPSRAHRHTPIPFGPIHYSSSYSPHSAEMQARPPPPTETVQVNGYNDPAIPSGPSSTSFEVPHAQQDNMSHYMTREQYRYGRPQHPHHEEHPFLRPAEWAQDELDGRFVGLSGPGQP